MNRRRWGIAAALAALAIAIAGWLISGRSAVRVRQARAAVVDQGIDPRLLKNAQYSRAVVQLEGPERQTDIVEFSSDIADYVYMAYLEPSDGTLWWLDELVGEGELCIRTTLYK